MRFLTIFCQIRSLNYGLDRYYTISDAKASSGIGLSISKEMVEEMGGKLGVDLLDQRLYISITFQRQVIE